MPKLLHPEDLRARCARQFARAHLNWLVDDAAATGPDWPVALPLGAPTQHEAAAEPTAVRAWAEAWRVWQDGGQGGGRTGEQASAQDRVQDDVQASVHVDGHVGQVQWQTRQWPRLGSQRLPAALVLGSAGELAVLAGQGTRWQRAVARHRRLCSACPSLVGQPITQRIFDALADYDDGNTERLLALVHWLNQHPASGLQLRQLPVPGLDTKWVEQRRGLIVDMALACWPQRASEASGRDLHALLGLCKPATRVRLRVLCGQLRAQLGGLGDLEAPLHELARLPIHPRLALVVENLDSGLALPNMPGAVALLKLGHAVNLLRQLPWLRAAHVLVWGDIDTHGLAILGRVRAALPQAEPMLMDNATLLRHRPLWVSEPQPYTGPPPDQLNAAERQLFDGLLNDHWGVGVRLEQERLPWTEVESALDALGTFGAMGH